MSAFAMSGLAVAMKRLNGAISSLEDFTATHGETFPGRSVYISEAHAGLLQARGELAAVQQLLDMEAELAEADTKPALRLVK